MAKPKEKPNPFRSFLGEAEADSTPELVIEPVVEEAPPQVEPVPVPASPLPIEAPAPAKKNGRQLGKRSNPDYIQVGAYIPKEVDRGVKRKLLDEDLDFSELVTKLLQDWLTG
jgi:hypothetical protein